jgi:hypothetical protein
MLVHAHPCAGGQGASRGEWHFHQPLPPLRQPIHRREGQGSWRLADGIDLDELAEAASTRFLYLLDVTDDFIVARFPIHQLGSEEDVEAYKASLREQHGADQAGSSLLLKDSADKGAEKRAPKARRA